jgi:hypothetical protein
VAAVSKCDANASFSASASVSAPQTHTAAGSYSIGFSAFVGLLGIMLLIFFAEWRRRRVAEAYQDTARYTRPRAEVEAARAGMTLAQALRLAERLGILRDIPAQMTMLEQQHQLQQRQQQKQQRQQLQLQLQQQQQQLLRQQLQLQEQAEAARRAAAGRQLQRLAGLQRANGSALEDAR